MVTNVCFLVFFLWKIKKTIPELLTPTIIKFQPFQAVNIGVSQNQNSPNTTFIGWKFHNDDVKIRGKRHVQRQIFTFNDLLDQRIRGNVVPQCPCVIKPGTDKCIAYDSRYQAAIIEEALVAFHDLTIDDSLKYPGTGIINAEMLSCQTLECQTCAAILLQRIKQIAMVPQDLQVSIPLARYIDPRNCQRIRFLKRFSIPKPPQPSYYVATLIEHGIQHAASSSEQQQNVYPTQGNHYWPSSGRAVYPSVSYHHHPYMQQPPSQPPPQQPPTGKTLVFHLPPPPSHVPPPQQYQIPFVQPLQTPQYRMQPPLIYANVNTSFTNGKVPSENETLEQVHSYGRMYESTRRRVKRQGDQPVLGTRYVIACVRNGEVDDENMLALCSTCWTWRKLPTDYFPPLINELICSTENNGQCLSGWGKCQQKYRNFDVLRHVNGIWQPTTIATATCCDCRIRAGSEIHPLVVGKRQN